MSKPKTRMKLIIQKPIKRLFKYSCICFNWSHILVLIGGIWIQLPCASRIAIRFLRFNGSKTSSRPALKATARQGAKEIVSCRSCGEVLGIEARLRLHITRRLCDDMEQCKHCGRGFDSYKATRKLGDMKPITGPEACSIMADIHLKSLTGKFMDKMVAATGLTINQVRHLREKDVYRST